PGLCRGERECSIGPGRHTSFEEAALLAGVGEDLHHGSRNSRAAGRQTIYRQRGRADAAIGRAGVYDAADAIAKHAVLGPGVAHNIGAVRANAIADIRLGGVLFDRVVRRAGGAGDAVGAVVARDVAFDARAAGALELDPRADIVYQCVPGYDVAGHR